MFTPDEKVLNQLRDRLVTTEMMASPTRVAIALRDLGRPSMDSEVNGYYDALRAEPKRTVTLMLATNAIDSVEKVLKAFGLKVTDQSYPSSGCGYINLTITQTD